MQLLVTGGAGFIGANFIRWVLAHTDDVHVTNYDLLTYAGNPASLQDLADDPRYRFVRGDIGDPDALTEAATGHDALVNFAAESHVDRSIEGPAAFLRTNVGGAGTVFEVAQRLEIPRLLHISTDEVYGSIDEGAFREEDALRPNSPYAASKASADLVARAFRETYGYPISVTRTTNNFGPYHYPEKVVPLFVTNLLDGGRVPLYGDGGHVREWTFVEDNAEAQWLVLTAGEPGEIYNIGSGHELSNLELTRHIIAALEADESAIEHVPDRPGHDRRYALDSSRIRALGWAPRHTFEEALDRTVAWYRSNEWWWRPLKERGASERRGLAARTAHRAAASETMP